MGARFSAPFQTGPGTYPASCTMGTGSSPGLKSGRGVTLTPQPFLVPWSRKSKAIPLLSLWAYSLHSASMPVQYSYTSTPPMGHTACTVPQCLYSRAIPLLSLWAYRLYSASVPVQYSYTSTPPMGHTVCTVPQCLYSTAISLLPLWAYGLYRASVPVQ